MNCATFLILGKTGGMLLSFALPVNSSPRNLFMLSLEYASLIVALFIFPKCRAMTAGNPKPKDKTSSRSN